jgi:MFS transporter, FSR family, fosmidomycin resistance protein
VLAGSLLELPMGMLAGQGRRRHRAVLGGGVAFILALAGAAFARTLPELLFAFIGFSPASGAFVTLMQAELMDAFPEKRAQHMARWDLAGSTGAVAGPLLVVVVIAVGGGWRDAYLVLAALSAVAWLCTCRRHATPPERATGADHDESSAVSEPAGRRGWTAQAREVIAALRGGGTLRWLILLQVADLLVDVLTGFVALYLVDVAHATPAVAALGVTIRLAAGLAGDAATVFVLERAGDLTVLRASAVAAALLYPAFLLADGLVLRLVVLAALTAATAPWYPVLQARLYGSLPGRSPVAVTLASAAGLAGGLGPLAVGLAAQAFGLPWALGGLTIVPAVILAGSAISRSG